MQGRPNSLLKAAAPSGPSIMMSSALTMRSGLPMVCSQGCGEAGNPQMRHRIAHQPGLGLGARARGALVADLAAGTGGCPGKRRDGRRVIVRLDLHQDVDGLVVCRRRCRWPDPENSARPRGLPLPRRCPGRPRARPAGASAWVLRIIANSDLLLRLAIDDETGIEDLVPAVLGVRLREHHQFHVGGIAPQPREVLRQVVDLVGAQRQPQRRRWPR